MAKTLSLSEQLEELYCVSLDGQREYGSNEERISKMKAMLANAMKNTLTERQLSCISKYYFENMKIKQIAAELGLHTSTVSRHMKAARKKLQKLRLMVE